VAHRVYRRPAAALQSDFGHFRPSVGPRAAAPGMEDGSASSRQTLDRADEKPGVVLVKTFRYSSAPDASSQGARPGAHGHQY